MAYLERVHAKGKTYLYLKKYAKRDHYAKNCHTVYSFGRVSQALENMYIWQKNYSLFPQKLRIIGCDEYDLNKWIKSLEEKAKIV